MQKLVIYFLLFIIYGFLGWLMEVICKLFQFKRFINRGFLIGPICPIYGFGVLGILFLNRNNANDYLAVFLKSILICSILEYFISYILEKLFKARWWDYSTKKFNINGRICLETMVPFGILGTIIVYINPYLIKLIKIIPSIWRLILAIIIFIILMVDIVISIVVMLRIKLEIKNQKSDNTEYIRKKVLDWLANNTFLYRHIKNAYPKFRISLKRKNIKVIGKRNIKETRCYISYINKRYF